MKIYKICYWDKKGNKQDGGIFLDKDMAIERAKVYINKSQNNHAYIEMLIEQNGMFILSDEMDV